ncbi:hemolysin family protein [Thermosulfuriphilus sp.]
MWEILPKFIVSVLLLATEAFFSGSEMSLVAADPAYLKRISRTNHSARMALYLIENSERLLTTTLLGLNLSVIGNSVITTAILLELFPQKGGLIAALVLPPLFLIFGQIIPKTYFRQKSHLWAPRLAPFVLLVSYLFYPVVALVSRLIRLVLTLFGVAPQRQAPSVTKEEIALLIKADSELDATERRLIEKIFSFGKKTASRVMIPLVQVTALPESASVETAIELFKKTGFSKIPIYRERIIQISGILYCFDLLEEENLSRPVGSLAKAAYYVPEFKPVSELLAEMQRTGRTMAVVVDEYGGALGIVTIEDLVEEVLGEFWDEFDPRRIPYVRLSENRYLVRGWMEIEDLNEELGLNLPPGEYETLGGFLMKLAGRIPRVGEVFRYGNIHFLIRKASPTTIDEVEVWIRSKT